MSSMDQKPRARSVKVAAFGDEESSPQLGPPTQLADSSPKVGPPAQTSRIVTFGSEEEEYIVERSFGSEEMEQCSTGSEGIASFGSARTTLSLNPDYQLRGTTSSTLLAWWLGHRQKLVCVLILT